MASRISLGKSFPEWKRQKEIFDDVHHPPAKTKMVFYPKDFMTGDGASASGTTTAKDRVNSSLFVEHLLELHARVCSSCNRYVNYIWFIIVTMFYYHRVGLCTPKYSSHTYRSQVCSLAFFGQTDTKLGLIQ